MEADEIIEELKRRNKEYVEGERITKEELLKSREETKQAQKPFACVIACSDSRVIPEYIFKAKIGEIFTIRTAGNVLDEIAKESLLYAIEHLNVKVVIVLGHQSCGAVTAIYNLQGEVKEGVKALYEKIKPAVEKAKQRNEGLREAIHYNAENVANEIREMKEVKERGVKVVRAYYSFSGEVEF